MPRHERGREGTVESLVTNQEPRVATPPEPGKSFLSTNVLVSSGTMLSRLTGFLRIVAIAAVLGDGNLSDAYNVANDLPNVVYELLVGGVLTAALVPLLVRLFEDDDNEGISALVTVVVFLSFVVAALATLGSPVVAWVTASPYLRSTVRNFAYFLLPEIFFYGISTLATSILNAKRRFIAAAYAPMLNNITVIVVLVIATKTFDLHRNFAEGRPSTAAIAFIGLGSTAGILVMSVALFPPLRDWLRTFHWHLDWSNRAVRSVMKMAPWAVGYVIANQVAYITVQRLAQRQVGGVSAYDYASTFFTLPHALLAVSVATTFTPNLASLARGSSWRRYSHTLSFGMRLVIFFAAPFAALMAVLSHPLASLLEHGKFGPTDAALTGRTLSALMIGLVGFSLYIFALRGFYAVQDARTPFYVNTAENVINLVLAAVLIGPYGVVGLGVAYATAYLVSAMVVLVLLQRRFPTFQLHAILWWLVRVGAAAAWCALVAWQVGRHVGSNRPLWGSLSRLVVAGLAGLIAYLAVMLLLGALEQPNRPSTSSRPR
jgi:putative peptidoglycan lipid II flippase